MSSGQSWARICATERTLLCKGIVWVASELQLIVVGSWFVGLRIKALNGESLYEEGHESYKV